ncbi:hypothetical protein GWI33_007362 [Rhynchophorus ferrugineus]|uniref:Uncharacterized protein n=1 Tax=Rhynchophorus ferrugineus TaxID=354439 RepID=A0A834IIZ9_RHYFE|nr:hypothetical protein GWI33_007362 [Rhynchophorus ferrugineus]
MGKKLLVTFAEVVMVALICSVVSGVNALVKKEDIESSLNIIHEVSTNSLGSLCVTESFRSLSVPLDTLLFEPARQKADLAATLLQDLGLAYHNGECFFIALN